MKGAWENAIKQGDVQIVLDLLGQGADVNARDHCGQTGLMLAAHAGHGEIIEILIAHRANLNITAKFGLNALLLALVAGHTEAAHLLAKAGADLDAVELLLQPGADPHLRTRIDDCEMPREMAEEAGLYEFAEFLSRWEARLG